MLGARSSDKFVSLFPDGWDEGGLEEGGEGVKEMLRMMQQMDEELATTDVAKTFSDPTMVSQEVSVLEEGIGARF